MTVALLRFLLACMRCVRPGTRTFEMRTVQRHLGFASPNAAFFHVRRLLKLGLIQGEDVGKRQQHTVYVLSCSVLFME